MAGRWTFAMPDARDVSEQQQLTSSWTLVAAPNVLEAHQGAESSDPIAPYDDVVLRRIAGTSVTDCGSFGTPVVMDNGVARRWVYSITRPRSAGCAAGAGIRFTAVGRKGLTERLTESVP